MALFTRWNITRIEIDPDSRVLDGSFSTQVDDQHHVLGHIEQPGPVASLGGVVACSGSSPPLRASVQRTSVWLPLPRGSVSEGLHSRRAPLQRNPSPTGPAITQRILVFFAIRLLLSCMSMQFPDPLPTGETVVAAPRITLLVTPPSLGQICVFQHFTNVRHQGERQLSGPELRYGFDPSGPCGWVFAGHRPSAFVMATGIGTILIKFPVYLKLMTEFPSLHTEDVGAERPH